MTSSPGWVLLQQLAYQVPGLLVALVGFILAIVFLRRYPRPAMLTLIGTGLLLLTGVFFTFLQASLLHMREDAGWSMETYATIVSVIGLASSLIRAVALGLVIAAVFVGRGRQPAQAE